MELVLNSFRSMFGDVSILTLLSWQLFFWLSEEGCSCAFDWNSTNLLYLLERALVGAQFVRGTKINRRWDEALIGKAMVECRGERF